MGVFYVLLTILKYNKSANSIKYGVYKKDIPNNLNKNLI